MTTSVHAQLQGWPSVEWHLPLHSWKLQEIQIFHFIARKEQVSLHGNPQPFPSALEHLKVSAASGFARSQHGFGFRL